MTDLNNKIDFVALLSVNMANPNGDPLGGNRPRTDYNGFGEISDVCIKRKIRNRMQDMEKEIFVQMNERSDDGLNNLRDRARALYSGKDDKELARLAKEQWLDVRTFGQVFAYDSTSIGIRGPVSIHQAVSVSPVEITSMQITKSVNGEPPKSKKGTESKTEDGKSRDTMGMKHFVRFGLYVVKGSINVQLAEKTGFSTDDAAVVKECLRTLFVNDSSSARPEGSMEVVKLYWFEHNCKDGQYSSAKVHRSVKVAVKDGISVPQSYDDYMVTVEPLEGLTPEIIDGI